MQRIIDSPTRYWYAKFKTTAQGNIRKTREQTKQGRKNERNKRQETEELLGPYTLNVPETLSLAVRTAASRSNPKPEDPASSDDRAAAYEFHSASREVGFSGSELLGPPINHAWAVFCILQPTFQLRQDGF